MFSDCASALSFSALELRRQCAMLSLDSCRLRKDFQGVGVGDRSGFVYIICKTLFLNLNSQL